jgi:hypothetical protein
MAIDHNANRIAVRLQINKLGLLAGASIASLFVGSTGAYAQCVSDPATPNTYSCTGTDPDGLYLNTSADINVTAGATVQSNNPTNRGIFIESLPGGQFINANINVDGTIQASAGGIRLSQRAPLAGQPLPGPISASIRVGETGRVSGSIGIVLSKLFSSQVSLNFLDNAGVIEGTTAATPVSFAGNQTTVQYILNRPTGRFTGSLLGTINALENQGTIDGVSEVAVDSIRNSLVNSGKITTTTSNGPAVLFSSPTQTFATNATGGIIETTGTSAAIQSQGALLTLTNDAGARISSGGPTAIDALSGLNLTNRGAIVGGIKSTSAVANAINTSNGGTITGGILLGAGNDQVNVDYGAATNPFGGVTGTVDAGAGTDTLTLNFKGATTLDSLVALPASFETLNYVVGAQGVLTLSSAFTAPPAIPAISIAGDVGSKLINNASLSGVTLTTSVSNLINNAAIRTAVTPGNTTITNSAGATINTAAQIGIGQTTIVNSGTIGSVIFNASNTTNGLGAIYVAQGGTITGSLVQNGFDSLTFVDRGSGTAGIGTLNPGLGLDIFVKSFATDGNYALSTALPTGFEFGGVEALGTAKVTVAGASDGTTSEGFGIYGTGGIVTTGKIGPVSFADTGFGLPDTFQLPAVSYGGNVGTTKQVLVPMFGGSSQSYTTGSALSSFVNQGDITGDVRLNTARFENAGTINLISTSLIGSLIVSAADKPFVFTNSGQIVMTGNAFPPSGQGDLFAGYRDEKFDVRSALDLSARQDVTITNSGSIARGLDVKTFAKTLTFDNTATGLLGGTSVSTNGGYLASGLYDGLGRVESVTINNAGSINGILSVETDAETSRFTNSGAIVGGAYLAFDSQDDLGDTAAASFTNSGTITAIAESSNASIAVDLGARTKSLVVTNTGTVELNQGATTTTYSDKAAFGVGNATYGDSTVSVTNSGTISSNAIGAAGLVVGTAALSNTNLPSTANTAVSITNSGRIASTGGTFLYPGSFLNPTTGQFENKATVELTAGLFAVAANFDDIRGSVTINNAAGAEILVSGLLRTAFQASSGPVASFVSVANTDGAGMIAVAAIADKVNITNAGRITGGVGGALPTTFAANGPSEVNYIIFPEGPQLDLAGTLLEDRYIAGAIQTAMSEDLVVNAATGVITGSVHLGQLNDRFENRGTINGNVFLGTGDDSMLHALTGSFTGTADGGAGTDTLTFDLSGQTFTSALQAQFINFETTQFTGSGTVSGQAAQTLQTVNLLGGTLNVAANSTLDTAGTVAITGTDAGNETVNNAGTLVGDVALLDGADVLNNSGSLTGNVALGAGNDVLGNSGTVTGNVDVGGGNNQIVNSSVINGSVTAGSGIDDFNNSGTISGSVDLGDGANKALVDTTGSLASLSTGAGNDEIKIGGSVAGSVSLNEGSNAVLMTGGQVGGAVSAGAGDDSFGISGGTVAGGINMGGGANSLAISGGNIGGAVSGGAGVDAVNVTGGTLGNVNLGDGANSLTISGGSVGGLVAGGADVDLVNATGGTLGSVDLGGGDNRVTLGTNATVTGNIATGAGADAIANAGTISGGLNLGDGNDSLTGSGTIAGLADLGAGDDTVALAALKGASGGVEGGAGTDMLLIDTTGGASFSPAVAALLSGFESVNATGTGTLDVSGTLNFGTLNVDGATVNVAAGNSFGAAGANSVTGAGNADRVTNAGTIAGGLDLAAGNDSVTNSGTITGAINLGAGADALTNTGRLAASVDLGDGDDSAALGVGGSFGALVNGGAGSDTLFLTRAGSATTPDELLLTNVVGFETTQLNTGVVALSGAYTTGTFNVSSGRLIGRSGSTISASTIVVASGATFGSAGTVNANITVNGTLSPGASPGVMNVVGNVALASGSNTVFELTPTVSDQLLISGALTIASNTTLTLTGDRPLTPGSTLDLIVAGGGITGSFATVAKPASILGFVAQRGNRIQLLGQFQVDAGFNTQQAATINYVNGVLVAGQGSAALLGALPSLLTAAGGTNAASFSVLNPEAYASASQIGAENGLSIAAAVRGGMLASASEEARPFAFGQALGDWRKLRGSAAAGVSSAKLNSYGMLGGIGYGSSSASVGAFVGYLDAKQQIAGLGARTDADGMIYGIAGRVAMGGVEATATFAVDRAKAKTVRSLPGGTNATGGYKLNSTVADVHIGYRSPIGGGWNLTPRAGITYVSTKRTGAIETGSAAFGLTVAGQSDKATFADAGFYLSGGEDDSAFKPDLGVGVRSQLNDNKLFRSATAGFTGTTSTFRAFGAGRKDLQITGTAGFTYQLGGNTSLFGRYEGEFGGGSGGHNVNAGIRIAF